MKSVNEEFWKFLSFSRNAYNLGIYIYLFCAAQFSFFAITFYLKYLPGDIFENMQAASFAECSASITMTFIVRWLGPNLGIAASFALATMACVLMMLVNQMESVTLIPWVVLLAKFSTTAAINMVYLNILYFFPNQFLGRIFGICGSIGKFFAIFAPMVAETPEPTPSLTLIIACSVATLVSPWLSNQEGDFNT